MSDIVILGEVMIELTTLGDKRYALGSSRRLTQCLQMLRACTEAGEPVADILHRSALHA